MQERDQYLQMDDAELLGKCRIDSFRGSGPGGQHRNTTDTAVRLTLRAAPNVTATACESRSQQQNRQAALFRLRLEIAYAWRSEQPPVWPGSWKMNPQRHHDYPRLLALLLDALQQHDLAIGAAAQALGRSTGQLIRVLAHDPQLWTWVNQQRQQRGMRALNSP